MKFFLLATLLILQTVQPCQAESLEFNGASYHPDYFTVITKENKEYILYKGKLLPVEKYAPVLINGNEYILYKGKLLPVDNE